MMLRPLSCKNKLGLKQISPDYIESLITLCVNYERGLLAHMCCTCTLLIVVLIHVHNFQVSFRQEINMTERVHIETELYLVFNLYCITRPPVHIQMHNVNLQISF